MSTTPYADFITGRGSTPQTKSIPGSAQVANSAGGFSYEVGDFEKLQRFLILGSEGGTYYIGESKLTADNAESVIKCLKEDGVRTVDTITEISASGRAIKNDAALFALALATVPEYADDATRTRAFDAIPKVARTGTHLYQFCNFVDGLRGWGRGLRRGLREWFESKDADQLAYQAVKYRQREGWTLRDVLRKAHPTDSIWSAPKRVTYDWICGHSTDWADAHDEEAEDGYEILPAAIEAYELTQSAATSDEVVNLIIRYGNKIPREAIPTQFLNDPAVWDALVAEGMPMQALVRNLATMTRNGTLTTTSEATQAVLKQLGDEEYIKASKLHPIKVLAALLTYSAGRSARGSNIWTPVTPIVDALDAAFYSAFANVEPTGKRRLIALDVSGSMTWSTLGGVPDLTPRVASAAMALVSLATGDPTETVAFASGRYGYSYGYGDSTKLDYNHGVDGIGVIPLSPRQRLDDVVQMVDNLPATGTDCALPMKYALAEGKEFDSFEIYTDSETWAGTPHPMQALKDYRQQSGINDAALVVIGMEANPFTIADPNDARSLDVVGFDTNAPAVIGDFIAGRL